MTSLLLRTTTTTTIATLAIIIEKPLITSNYWGGREKMADKNKFLTDKMTALSYVGAADEKRTQNELEKYTPLPFFFYYISVEWFERSRFGWVTCVFTSISFSVCLSRLRELHHLKEGTTTVRHENQLDNTLFSITGCVNRWYARFCTSVSVSLETNIYI